MIYNVADLSYARTPVTPGWRIPHASQFGFGGKSAFIAAAREDVGRHDINTLVAPSILKATPPQHAALGSVRATIVESSPLDFRLQTSGGIIHSRSGPLPCASLPGY
jgi:hypothetical protein